MFYVVKYCIYETFGISQIPKKNKVEESVYYEY